MQNGIPKRNADVEGVDLAQNLRREDEQQDDRLEEVRELDVERVLEKRGDEQEHEGEDAQHHVLIVPQERRAHERYEHEGAQDEVQVKDHRLVLALLMHGLLRAGEKSGHGSSDLRIYYLA